MMLLPALAFFLQILLTADLAVLSVLSGPVPQARHKRNALQMCELVAHHTNRGCLDYNNYGCFCGLGNAASNHVDAVDLCCRVHDQCYGNVYCYWIYPQIVGYTFNCSEEPCVCTDSPLMAPCAYSTCQCDLAFAQCLARASYNHGFSNYDRSRCHRPARRGRRRLRARRQRRETTSNLWRQILLDHEKRLS